MINIEELHKDKKQKILRKNEVYEKILMKCHGRIRSISKIPQAPECCMFEVPSYIYGAPLFDINKCIYYLLECLSENGFDVEFINPNFIYISWEGKKNPKNFKTLEKKQERKYKYIEDYKPSEGLVYDTKALDVFKKKLTFF